ncbi:MAG TPA: hypothetical protein PKA97_00415 [Candidatus Nanoperiomorbaceae bacterium]|nr:hypothetical protein [Candidatus Nanoperiomorbaceae bacterium]
MSDSTTTKSIRGIGLYLNDEGNLVASASGADSLKLTAHLTAQVTAGRYYRHATADITKLGDDTYQVTFRLTPKTSLEQFEKFVLNTVALWYGANRMSLD